MGTDKGLIPVHGKTITEHIIDQLKPVVDQVFIVSGNPDYAVFNLELIPDIIKNSGPAGGIHAALSHTHTQRNFIVSCDMPFVTSAAIEYFLHLKDEKEITVPLHQGKIEPLFGIYHRSCLARWDELIRRGFLKLQEMIACFDLLKADVSANPLFGYPFFANINTPGDLEKALTNTDL